MFAPQAAAMTCTSDLLRARCSRAVPTPTTTHSRKKTLMHQRLFEPKCMPDLTIAGICETRNCSPTDFGRAAFHDAGIPSTTVLHWAMLAKRLLRHRASHMARPGILTCVAGAPLQHRRGAALCQGTGHGARPGIPTCMAGAPLQHRHGAALCQGTGHGARPGILTCVAGAPLQHRR